MGATPQPIHLLHVDDEPNLAEMVAEFLQRSDARISVDIAASASEGLDQLEEYDYDCVVSDYDMPGQNGIEFLETVREENPNLPFILYTGKGSEEVASEAIAAGVSDYLQKGSGTSQYEVLANRIRNLVEKRRSEKEVAERKYRTKRFLEHSSDYLFVVDESGNISYISPSVERVLGYNPDEMMGGNAFEFTYPEDVEKATEAFTQTVDHPEEEVTEEIRAKHADGGYRWLEVRGRNLLADPVIGGILVNARDITERKERQRELRETKSDLATSLDRYQTLVEQNLVGIYLLQDNHFEYVNPKFCEITGYEEEDFASLEAMELIAPESRDEVKANIENRLSGDIKEVDYTPTIVRKNGERRSVHAHGTRIERAGEPAILGTLIDITDRVETQEELEREHELLDQVFATSPAGIVILTTDGHIERANSQAEQVLGLSRSEITDRTYDDPDWNLVDSTGDPISEDELPFARVMETGEPVYDFEHGISGPDGTQRWISVNAAPLPADNGEFERVVAVVHDVTDSGGRERALREVYDIMSNRDYSFEEQIEALLEFGRIELGTEYGSLSEIQGDDYVFEVVAADDESIQAEEVVPVSTTICEFAASSERTIVLGDVERDAPEATDRAIYADWGISCYLGAPVFVDDEVYGTFCFYDTEAKSGQFSEWEVTLIDLMSRWVSYGLQRRQMNAQLQEKNEQLEQFAGIISHDLRNPLNVAQGRLELMADDCDSEHFSPVSGALDRMEALIEDMLSMAQEETLEPSLQSVDLESTFAGCWGNVDTGDIKLTNDLKGTIQADEGRLKQLMENLIRNAVQHGGKDVSVRVGNLDGGFYVEDTGPGIPEDARNSIFEAGHSTDATGNGLGLGIVKRVAEVHSWTLGIESGDTGGARFEITGTKLTAR